MSACDVHRPQLGGYVLEALEPGEAQALREHLRDCAACSAELGSLAGLPALLDLASAHAPPAEPIAPAVEEAVLDRFAHDRGARRRRLRVRGRRRFAFAWTRPRVALASAALAATLAGGTVAVLEHEPAPSGRWDGAYVLPLRAGPTAPGASGRVGLEKVRGGTSVRLWARGLPAGPGQVYEMLCEGRGLSASAGTFRADARGRVYARLTTAARVGEYERIRIVAVGGRGGEVLAGRIF